MLGPMVVGPIDSPELAKLRAVVFVGAVRKLYEVHISGAKNRNSRSLALPKIEIPRFQRIASST